MEIWVDIEYDVGHAYMESFKKCIEQAEAKFPMEVIR